MSETLKKALAEAARTVVVPVIVAVASAVLTEQLNKRYAAKRKKQEKNDE